MYIVLFPFVLFHFTLSPYINFLSSVTFFLNPSFSVLTLGKSYHDKIIIFFVKLHRYWCPPSWLTFFTINIPSLQPQGNFEIVLSYLISYTFEKSNTYTVLPLFIISPTTNVFLVSSDSCYFVCYFTVVI